MTEHNGPPRTGAPLPPSPASHATSLEGTEDARGTRNGAGADAAEQNRYQRAQGLVTLAAVLRRTDLDAVARLMVETYCAEIDSYARLPRAVLEGRKLDVARANLALFAELAESQRDIVDSDLETARAGARADVADGIPLDDLLKAYRIGGLVCWREITPNGLPEEHFAAVAAGELYMRYAETMSTAVTAAYNEELARIGPREDRQHRALFHGIAHGDATERELAQLADELGLPLRSAYVPFAIAWTAGTPAELASVLRARGVFAVADGDGVAGFALGDLAEDALAVAQATVALGPLTQRAELPGALEDLHALADLGRRRGRTGPIGEREFLIERCLVAAPRMGATLERVLLAPLDEHDAAQGSELVATLEAFVARGLSRKAAAQDLHVHPNTLDYRLDQIRKLTDLRLGDPRDVALTTLALTQRSLAAL